MGLQQRHRLRDLGGFLAAPTLSRGQLLEGPQYYLSGESVHELWNSRTPLLGYYNVKLSFDKLIRADVTVFTSAANCIFRC